jgi:hypothetical protein
MRGIWKNYPEQRIPNPSLNAFQNGAVREKTGKSGTYATLLAHKSPTTMPHYATWCDM